SSLAASSDGPSPNCLSHQSHKLIDEATRNVSAVISRPKPQPRSLPFQLNTVHLYELKPEHFLSSTPLTSGDLNHVLASALELFFPLCGKTPDATLPFTTQSSS
uniref:Uncharacterized protein n=1 Tax=Gouania willdenowi TaxID=441366 RepID=A0A8C5D840_GOUWI